MAVHSQIFNYDFAYWELRHKVTFDGERRLILINYGETAIDFETDIYSDWKEWLKLRRNGKYAQAIRSVGGDPLNQEGDALGATFFLVNGWRIQTWDGDHELTIFGNFVVDDAFGLFSDSGGVSADPAFSDRAGRPSVLPQGPNSNSTIQVTNSVSNLVDKINTGGGGGGATAEEIAEAVWSKIIEANPTAGSYGERVALQKVFVNLDKDLVIEVDD